MGDRTGIAAGRGASSDPAFFATGGQFRDWLAEHHDTVTELIVGFWKAGSGKPSMTWPDSVDAALCFGWIDGVRRRRDDESYTIRFTHRRPGSIWSAVNVAKVEALVAAGLMAPAGMAAFAARRAVVHWLHSAKREETRIRRLEQLVADSASGRQVAPFRRR